jgi:site-specific recombinase XerD
VASYYRKGTTFAVAYRLKGGPRRFIYGLKTERLARQASAKMEQDEQLSRAGLLSAHSDAEGLAAAEQKPLAKHIEDFRQSILDRGKDKRYAQQQASHARRLLSLAKIATVGGISCEAIQRALKRLLGPQQGPRTCNAARQAVIQFERYLKRNGKIRQTVLHNLERFNESEDIRRKRRALTQDEVDWLLETTSNNRDRTSRRCGICPADRALLYATGIGTGFRKSALLSLQIQSFFVGVDMEQPFVRLAAKHNKNRKNRKQMIPLDLAERLRRSLSGRRPQEPVWRPFPHADLALRFRRDMEAARAAWLASAPSDDERDRREKSHTLKYVYNDGDRNIYADFHSLRHTGITFAVRRAWIRVGQEWADHSTPVLTSRYAEVDNADLQKAIDGLPRLSNAKFIANHNLAQSDTRRG